MKCLTLQAGSVLLLKDSHVVRILHSFFLKNMRNVKQEDRQIKKLKINYNAGTYFVGFKCTPVTPGPEGLARFRLPSISFIYVMKMFYFILLATLLTLLRDLDTPLHPPQLRACNDRQMDGLTHRQHSRLAGRQTCT